MDHIVLVTKICLNNNSSVVDVWKDTNLQQALQVLDPQDCLWQRVTGQMKRPLANQQSDKDDTLPNSEEDSHAANKGE